VKKIAYLLPAICLASLSMHSTAAHADSVNLSSYVGQTLEMTVEPYASGENNGSYFVGLTQLNFSTTRGQSLGSIEGFCDDFNDEISVPDTYKVTVEKVAGNKTFEEEAFYGMEFTGNNALDTELQELIWDLGDPGAYAKTAAMLNLQSSMLANYAGVDYSDSFYLNADGKGQSFMVAVDPSPSPVPEPSTLLTFGTGLFAAAGFARRRFLRS
jgi:PEP-CTERM motif